MRISDWSSDVCSSDLTARRYPAVARQYLFGQGRARAEQAADEDRSARRCSRVGDRGRESPDQAIHQALHGRGGVADRRVGALAAGGVRSEEHTSELQSLMRISYAVFCLKKNKTKHHTPRIN